MTHTLSVLVDVRSAYKAGLTLLPVAEDGTKRPALPEWKTYQQQRPTPDRHAAVELCRSGRIRHGRRSCQRTTASAGTSTTQPTFEAFLEAAAATGLADVIQRIRDGYEDQTPNGGRRWIVRYPPDVTWADTVYARRPGRPGEKPVVTLIETTLFAVLAPSNGSVHPTGRPYVRVSGSFATIASYTQEERAAVIALARSFDQLPRREAPAPRSAASGDRPGDDFNRRARLARDSDPARLDRGRRPRRRSTTGADRRSRSGSRRAPTARRACCGCSRARRRLRRMCRTRNSGRTRCSSMAATMRRRPQALALRGYGARSTAVADRPAASAGGAPGRPTAPHDPGDGVSDRTRAVALAVTACRWGRSRCSAAVKGSASLSASPISPRT